jgi:phenylacetate-CoA ligase
MISLSVITPCLNEENNISELVARVYAVFRKLDISGQLVVIDDGSTDSTPLVLDDLVKKYPYLTIVSHQQNEGLEASWKSGLEVSSGEWVCVIDSDLQYQPEDIEKLYLEAQKLESEFVQGCRIPDENYKFERLLMSRVLNGMLNFLFRMDSLDNKSGFFVCKHGTLSRLLDHKFNYYYFQSFISVAAHKRAMSISELMTEFKVREKGTSFIPSFPVKTIFKVLVDLVKGFVEFNFMVTETSSIAMTKMEEQPTLRVMDAIESQGEELEDPANEVTPEVETPQLGI